MPDIVGTGHEGRAEIIRSHVGKGTQVYLVREPNNEFDTNAVAICVDTPGFLWFKGGLEKIGYVDKERAVKLAQKLDSGVEYEAEVISCFAPEEMKHPRVTVSWWKKK